MQIIASARRTGKTSQLIRMAAGRNGYIVVHNTAAVRDVMDLARQMEAVINIPLTLHELERDGRGAGFARGTPLFFDNVELMLQAMAPRFDVQAMTINDGEFPPEHREAAEWKSSLTPSEQAAARDVGLFSDFIDRATGGKPSQAPPA